MSSWLRVFVSSVASVTSVSSFFTFVPFVTIFVSFVIFPGTAHAQLYESVGIRAQGMGGAFVAVADDAEGSTWWNPAGLAIGPFFSGIVEQRTGQGASAEGATGVAFAVPSLGLSYYRLQIGRLAPVPTGLAAVDRQDQSTASVRLPSFILNEFGVTVGQSLGQHLVLASTLRLVHADQTGADLDLGAMVKVGSVRFGVSAKNLYKPGLTADGIAVDLNRQVRVGAAYAPRAGKTVSLIADFDADLTTTSTEAGDERHIAGGAELRTGRIGVRGGLSGNTVGDVRRAYSGGASLGIAAKAFLDAQITRGDDDAKKGWGVALRVTF
jgi:hypothetical protein